NVVILLTSIRLLGHAGPLWACAGVGVAFAILAVAGMVMVRAEDGVDLGRLLGGVLPPLVACGPMAAAVLGVRHLLEPVGLRPIVLLAVELIVGAVVYVPSALLLAREVSREFLRLFREAVLKR